MSLRGWQGTLQVSRVSEELRKHAFVLTARNSVGALFFFRLPPHRVIGLGIQLEI